LTGELIGWEQLILFNNYGERWRRQRKFTHAHFNKVAAKQHWPLHEAQTIYFLKKLLQSPEAFRSDFRLTAGRGILMTTYGIKVESAKDRFIVVPEEVMANLILPGAYLVDSFPILKHLPEWFPGAGFQKIAKSVGAALREMAESPFERVKKDMAAGVAVPSMTSNLLENILGDEEAEDNLKTAAGTMYAGGSDTTVSAMMSFLIAMLRYPSILRKAQAEIDQVIGDHRLPTLDDREHLPYVNAVIKEVLRWYPVSSMSAPHLPLEDDIYEGYFIPKGATVLPCQWAISRDTRHYPDPEEFIPERFLKIDEKTGKPPLDPVLYAFGFGRRICPGIHFAEASLFLHISCVLATFNIERAVDENGKEKLPVPGHVGEGAVMNHPEFECRITPRSANAVSLIESAALA
jgi:cytochrome P450